MKSGNISDTSIHSPEIDVQLALIRERLTTSRDFATAADYLFDASQTIPGFIDKLQNVPYSYFDCFYSLFISNENLKKTQELFEYLNSLNLLSVPLLAETLYFAERGGCLVFQVKGVNGQQKLKPVAPGETISEHALERLIVDLECLAKAGWYHPWALESTDHWLIHPSTADILLFSWDCIRPIRTNEAESIRRELCTLFLANS